MLRLRLRGPSGTATGSFDGASSIESFLAAASEQLGCTGAKLDMLVGFPPKQCKVSGAPLSSVVGSGDTVVLNVLAAAPEPELVPAPAAPASSLAGGMWACLVCTLENEAVAPACVACETPRPGGGGGKAQLQKMADDNSCAYLSQVIVCRTLLRRRGRSLRGPTYGTVRLWHARLGLGLAPCTCRVPWS